jgi:hypothetical protein
LTPLRANGHHSAARILEECHWKDFDLDELNSIELTINDLDELLATDKKEESC